MKSTLLYILCGLAFLPLTLKGQKGDPMVYTGSVFVKQNVAEVRNDSLFLDMDISICDIPVYRTYSLVLIPELFAGRDSQSLSYIKVNGRHKSRMYKRQMVLSKGKKADPSAYVVLRDDSLMKVVSYKDTLIYEPWMKDAGLRLRGEFRKYNDESIAIYEDILIENLNLRP